MRSQCPFCGRYPRTSISVWWNGISYREAWRLDGLTEVICALALPFGFVGFKCRNF